MNVKHNATSFAIILLHYKKVNTKEIESYDI